MPGPEIYSSPDDPVFAAAFRQLLEERGMNQKEFCELTRAEPDGPRRIAPSTASTWVTGKGQPSNQAAWLTTRILGVTRSEFWQLGETLWELRESEAREERRRRAREDQDLEAVEELFDELDDARATHLLERLEERRKQRLAS